MEKLIALVAKSDINSLSLDEAIDSYRIVTKLLYKAKGDNDGRAINAIEKKLIKDLTSRWNKDANKVIGKVEKSMSNKSSLLNDSEIKKLEKIARRDLEDYGEKFKKRIEDDITEIYSISKESFEKKNKIKKYIKKAIELTAFDISAISSLSDQYRTALNAYYNGNISEVFVRAVEKVSFKKALTRPEQIKEVVKALEKNLGLPEQNLRGLAPEGFKGTAKQYFSNEIQSVVTRARSFGSLQSLREAEITTYTVVNPAPISQICKEMNGRTLRTEIAVKTMERMLNAQTPDEVKAITPFRKNLKEFGITGPGQKLNNKTVNTRIQESGLSFPPYHSACKSEVEIIRERR